MPTQTSQTQKQITDADPCHDFIGIFNSLSVSRDRHRLWDDFILMSACIISNQFDQERLKPRKRKYLNLVRNYTREEQIMLSKMFAYTELALNKHPEQDFLGNIYSDLGLFDIRKGEFIPRYNVCKMLADMMFDQDIKGEVKEKGCTVFTDPSCGSGYILLAAVEKAVNILKPLGMDYRTCVYIEAEDSDKIQALMCYIQLSLLGAAAKIKAGVPADGTTETVKRCEWLTPMLLSSVWEDRI